MIYSGTMFFNEFDLLDLKIAEELPYIDKLIIVDADRTHSNAPKPLHLYGNNKYKHPKIEIVYVGNEFNDDSYFNEAQQRDAALSNINLKDDDVLILTDLDEILKSEDLPKIIESTYKHGLVRLAMFHYYYKINLVTSTVSKWHLPFAITGKYLRECKQTLTHIRRHEKLGVVINTDGRHFGYLSNPAGIAYKIKSFLHTNFNQPLYTDLANIEKRIKEHKDPYDRTNRDLLIKVEVDSTYPKTILNNMEYWKQYIEP